MTAFLRRFDWLAFAAMLALVVVGVAFIGSAGEARQVAALKEAWKVHAATAGAGLVLYFALAAVDYRRLLDFTAWPVFVLSVVFLVAVLVFGSSIYGGRRWLWFFQPSEVAKPAVILLLAQLFGRPRAAGLVDEATRRRARRLFGFPGFALASAIVGVPLFLILAEPDLGTALVLVPVAVALLLGARVWTRGLVALLVGAFILGGAVLGTFFVAEHRLDESARAKVYAALPLKPHQINRLVTFVNPGRDPYGGGWNLRQARISIGSGSLTGKGFRKGDAKALGYLPPSVSMNDFIFSVLAEELGFMGSAGVLAAFLALFAAILRTAYRARDDRGRLVAAGAATLVFSHLYVNVAMSVGLMPITGLPLPFISAGKTFLVALLALLGVVQSVAVHPDAEAGQE